MEDLVLRPYDKKPNHVAAYVMYGFALAGAVVALWHIIDGTPEAGAIFLLIPAILAGMGAYFDWAYNAPEYWVVGESSFTVDQSPFSKTILWADVSRVSAIPRATTPFPAVVSVETDGPEQFELRPWETASAQIVDSVLTAFVTNVPPSSVDPLTLLVLAYARRLQSETDVGSGGVVGWVDSAAAPKSDAVSSPRRVLVEALRGRLGECCRSAKEVIAGGDDSWDMWLAKAICESRMKDPQGAQASLRRALAAGVPTELVPAFEEASQRLVGERGADDDESSA